MNGLRTVMKRSALSGLVVAALASLPPGAAIAAGAGPANGGGTEAEAERSIQTYLSIWSHNSAIDMASVRRFYAPRVVYYGKTMSRAEILADKLAYIRAWPERHYREVPGTMEARCNGDRSRCRVSVVMAWRRVGRHERTSTGRARIAFDFVPADGGRKIARESARDLN